MVVVTQVWDTVHTQLEAAKVFERYKVDQRKNIQNNLHVLQRQDW
jgi:hypothetical protein